VTPTGGGFVWIRCGRWRGSREHAGVAAPRWLAVALESGSPMGLEMGSPVGSEFYFVF